MDICSINWEALATFSAGVAAVIGAVYVGRNQTKIQSRQVELEELKIRTDLFEKRFATYEATATLLTRMNTFIEDRSREKLGGWLLLYRQSLFLFGPRVYHQLTEILEYYNKYELNMRDIAQLHGYDEPKRIELNKKQLEVMSWIAKRIMTVHEIFEADLTLATPIAMQKAIVGNPAKRPE